MIQTLGKEILLKVSVKIEKIGSEGEPSNSVKFSAYRLQTSDLKSDLHEINGVLILSGNTISMTCIRKAAFREHRKHIDATLVYDNRFLTLKLF